MRLFLTTLAGVTCLYIVGGVGAALLTALLPAWLAFVVAFALAAGAAFIAGRAVWRAMQETRVGEGSILMAIANGALIVGSIGFAAGFFGPIIFTPEANQGPLLGIFITGPIGVVVGAVGGLIAGMRGQGKSGAPATPGAPSA
jgi:hypothetical protein